MLKGLQHCSLVVSDLDKARWFYGEFLGMKEVPRPSNFTFAGAWFRSQGTEIHMITGQDTTAAPGLPDPGEGEITGLATHFAFEVEDVYAMRQRAEEMGVDIVNGPIPRGDGAYQLYVHDPDRYLVELFQWIDSGEGAAERGAVRGATGSGL